MFHQILSTLNTLHQEKDSNTLIKKALHSIHTYIPSEVISISLFHHKKPLHYTSAHKDPSKNPHPSIHTPPLLEASPLIDYAPKKRTIPDYPHPLKNLINIKLRTRSKTLGILQLGNTPEELPESAVLEFLAKELASVIHQTELIHTLEQRQEKFLERLSKLRYLSKITILEAIPEDIHATFTNIFKTLVHTLKIKQAALLLYHPEDSELHCLSSLGHDVNPVHALESITQHLLNNQTALLVNPFSCKSMPHYASISTTYTSFVAVLLRTHAEILGVITLTEKKQSLPFNALDLQVLVNVAKHMTSLYERDHLKHKLIKQKSLQTEISITKDLQKKLLPLKLPSIRGLRTHLYKGAPQTQSTFFYDFLVLDKKKLGFMLCKIPGQGLLSALSNAFSKNALRSFMSQYASPKYVLESLFRHPLYNRFFNKSLEILCGIIDVENAVLSYTAYQASSLKLTLYEPDSNYLQILKKNSQIARPTKLSEYLISIPLQHTLAIWSLQPKVPDSEEVHVELQSFIQKHQHSSKQPSRISKSPLKNLGVLLLISIKPLENSSRK